MRGERAWLALLDSPREGASAAAEVGDLESGEPAGWIGVWVQRNKPVRGAMQVDPAAFDPSGPAGRASLVLLPPGRDVIFDDPAVQRARQVILATAGAWSSVTTFVSDAVHFRGSLIARPGEGPSLDDPFAQIAPARRLRVDPGLISPGPLHLSSPVVERYAGKPWPQSGF